MSAPEPTSGPWLENHESAPVGSSTEPMVSALTAAPGDPTVSGAVELPAATTKSASVSAEIVFSASDITSVPSEPCRVPRLIEMMSARWAAHSIAAMIHESWPEPAVSSTLPTSRFAPSATPRCVPPLAAPVPAIVEATCVPWPLTSSPTSSPGTKLDESASTRPARSGWVSSYPESSTATVTPSPVYPAAHASGAPMYGTLESSVACTLPSRWIASMPPPSVGSVGSAPNERGPDAASSVSAAQVSAAFA